MYATAFDEFKRHILITELSNLGDTLRTTVFWFIIGRTGTWIMAPSGFPGKDGVSIVKILSLVSKSFLTGMCIS